MKRIEEFTAEELYRVWADAVDGSIGSFLAVIDYIKANLDTGFVVDWSRAPEFAKSVKWHWSHDADGENVISTRPAPKMRQKTREEKIAEIVAKIGDNGMLWEYSDEVVDYICSAADIQLETEE